MTTFFIPNSLAFERHFGLNASPPEKPRDPIDQIVDHHFEEMDAWSLAKCTPCVKKIPTFLQGLPLGLPMAQHFGMVPSDCNSCRPIIFQGKDQVEERIASQFLGKRIQLWEKQQVYEEDRYRKRKPISDYERKWYASKVAEDDNFVGEFPIYLRRAVESFEYTLVVKRASLISGVLLEHKNLLSRDEGQLKGFLWKATYRKSTCFLIGTLHERRKPVENDEDLSPENLAASLDARIVRALQASQSIFIELDDLDKGSQCGMSDAELKHRAERPGIERALISVANLNGKVVKEMEKIETHKAISEAILEEGVKRGSALSKFSKHVADQIFDELLFDDFLYDAGRWGNYSSLDSCYRYLREKSNMLDVLDCDGRTAEMVKQIFASLEKGESHTFAFGALHFPGPAGALHLLRQRGVQIEEVP